MAKGHGHPRGISQWPHPLVLDLVKEVFNLKVELLHDVFLAKAKSNHMFEKVTCTCNFKLFQLMIFLGQFCQFLDKFVYSNVD